MRTITVSLLSTNREFSQGNMMSPFSMSTPARNDTKIVQARIQIVDVNLDLTFDEDPPDEVTAAMVHFITNNDEQLGIPGGLRRRAYSSVIQA